MNFTQMQSTIQTCLNKQFLLVPDTEPIALSVDA